MSDQPGWIERIDELHLLTPLRVLLILLVAWVLARVLRVVVARLLNGWPRVAAVAARAVLPWLQARWVVIEAKVRCTSASPMNNFDVGNIIFCLH